MLRIGHRGAAAYATENTLSSIQTALSCGVDMVEVDVRQTRDHQLILAHDPMIVANGRRRLVKRQTLAELQRVSLPGGEMVTSLAEALTFMRGRAKVNIDLKVGGIEEAVVDLVHRLAMEEDVMVSSLSIVSLKRIKSLNPQLFVALSYPSSFMLKLAHTRLVRGVGKLLGERQRPLWPFMLILRRLLPYQIKFVAAIQGIDALMIRAPFVTPKLVDVVHHKELKLYTWPADHATDVAKLEQWGVDGIESNRPDVFVRPPATT
jgi:glycerophosphoryl diester phosphodiesterase